jgi:hypothetical protein
LGAQAVTKKLSTSNTASILEILEDISFLLV